MRVVTTGVCRGNWKIYQQLKIEGIHEASSNSPSDYGR